MRILNADFMPSALVAAALVGAICVFVSETRSFRSAVTEWAERDLRSRTELAAANLREPLATGDFRAIHEFGAACSADGVRLTVFSGPNGVVFDSLGRRVDEPESIYSTQQCGEFRVRLGLPVERVLAPYRRARYGFLLAAIMGGAGVMLVVLFTVRQRARLRELARERDAQSQLVEELRKVEMFRRDFIADVSHEIKTPLTGILGAVDMLADGNLPDGMEARLIGMVKSESTRLNALAQGILSLARLERDDASVALSRTRVDLSVLSREIVERFASQAEERGSSIELHSTGLCEAECDVQLVDSAISNLLANAIRHSGAKRILMAATAIGGMACVSVEDDGVGIPPEHREKVFERFHRVDGSRSADTGGAGLGLAIVRRIARLHGGDVKLEPVSPSGCRFILSIPIAIPVKTAHLVDDVCGEPPRQIQASNIKTPNGQLE